MMVCMSKDHAIVVDIGQQDIIRISGIVPQSIVDGPGLRMTVFTQGCPHRCLGCHNPQTHDFTGGYDCKVKDILAKFDQNPLLAGLTISGGEPFSQAKQLIPLAKKIRERGKNIWCYTGYTFEEIMKMAEGNADIMRFCALIDVLVDGRFVLFKRNLDILFRGSDNQRILDMPRSIMEGVACEWINPDTF